MRNWRINLILTFIFLFAAAIIGRLVFLQILNHDLYKALAGGQQKIFSASSKKRGEIFLQDKEKNLYPLAINKNSPLVYVLPKEIKDIDKTAEELSEILSLEKEFILEKINDHGKLYQLIKNKLTKQEKLSLIEKNFPGVYLQTESLRYYPQAELASQTIGFLGGEGKGQYGIEGFYEEILQPSGAFKEQEDFSQEKSFFKNIPKDLKEPSFILTLDYNIQSTAEKLLEQAHQKLKFNEAQIIVADPESGKILALANFPNFNPNHYQNETNLEIFQNSSIQKIFEPGSVFKPITMASALQEEKITPETTYQDTGEVKIGGLTIYNYDKRVWGETTITQVLEKSINTGAVFAEKELGHKLFLDYIKKFGFLEPTNIDLQGELFSSNTEFQKGYEINFATASFGQGIEITPIQLIKAFSAIANGGELPRPYLLEEIQDGRKTIKIPELRDEFDSGKTQILSKKTCSQTTAMLVSVVEQGFAKAAKIPGYYIAGKTGTAQIPFSALGENRRGYSDETIQTFIGFAPAFNPRFTALVKLNNPQTKTAEYSAIPIFRDLAKYIIDYYQIPPDYE